jgi:hypothetical protein
MGRLGYPHQVLVGSPHVHSSRLVPVSSAGFLIKCLHFIGMTCRAFAQVRPMSLCVAVCAPFGLFLPVGVLAPCVFSLVLSVFMSTAQQRCDMAISSRLGSFPPVGVLPPCVCFRSSVHFYVCRPAVVRHGDIQPPCRFAWPFARRLGYIHPWGAWYSELPQGGAFFCASSATPTACRRTPLFLYGCVFFKPRWVVLLLFASPIRLHLQTPDGAAVACTNSPRAWGTLLYSMFACWRHSYPR